MKHFTLPYIERKSKLDALAQLLKRPWAMLLDSGGTDLEYNRYDIFSFSPSVTLTFDNQEVVLNKTFKSLALDLTMPLDCMRKLLDFHDPKIKDISNLPFNGGWLGYISYDFGRHLEKLPTIASDDIKLPQIQMGLYQWALITDHKSKSTRIYNFGLDEASWLNIIELFSTLSEDHNAQSEEFRLITNWESNTSEKQYHQAFNVIQDYIHSGDCYQVNFAQKFTAQYAGSALTAYQKLTHANKAPFSAFFNFEDHQILSLSPERFIETHQKRVSTQPIKGTRPRSIDQEEDKMLAEELKNSIKTVP